MDHEKPEVPAIYLQSLGAAPEPSYATHWQYLTEAHQKFPKEHTFNRTIEDAAHPTKDFKHLSFFS